MPGIKELKEFVDYAEKNRKYASETARGKRTAFRLFEKALNEDEAASVDLINERFEKIYSEVVQKNKMSVKMSALEVYKRRIRGLLNDYKKYANDATAFNLWDSGKKTSTQKKGASANFSKVAPRIVEAQIVEGDMVDEEKLLGAVARQEDSIFSTDFNNIEFFLRSGFKVNLILPADMTQKEANRLKHMIDGMVSEDDQDGI
jgi:hypothetical protein